jgi:membrane protease YdiL (CAAX protease family)
VREAARSDSALAQGVYQKLALGLASQLALRVRSQLDASTRSEHERLVLGEFTVNVLILVSLYVLFQSALPLVRHYLPASTSVISLPLIVLFGLASLRFMQTSGYPAAFFGLGLRHLFMSLVESIAFTVPFLALVTGLKALRVASGDGFDGVIEYPDFIARLTDPDLRVWLGIYAASSVVQELIVRSVLQSTLIAFLPGRSGAIRAIVVCALLFSVSHLHISLVFALAAFVPGIFWGWLYHRRRHLIGPALSHVVVGVTVFFVLGP